MNTAEWIYGENSYGQDGWFCSKCRFFQPWDYDYTDDIDFIRDYYYCPHCGRKMMTFTGKETDLKETLSYSDNRSIANDGNAHS